MSMQQPNPAGTQCQSCFGPATHRFNGQDLCEACVRRDVHHTRGELFAAMGILAVVLESLRDAGLSDSEILNACYRSLEESVDVPDFAGTPKWACGGFEHDTRVEVLR